MVTLSAVREGLKGISSLFKPWPNAMACVTYNSVGIIKNEDENFTSEDWLNTLKSALTENGLIRIQPIVGSGLPINLIKENNTIDLSEDVFKDETENYINYNILDTFIYYRSLGTALGRFLCVYYSSYYKLTFDTLSEAANKLIEKNNNLKLSEKQTKLENIRKKRKIMLILKGIYEFIYEYYSYKVTILDRNLLDMMKKIKEAFIQIFNELIPEYPAGTQQREHIIAAMSPELLEYGTLSSVGASILGAFSSSPS